jgi:hypothetical protein
VKKRTEDEFTVKAKFTSSEEFSIYRLMIGDGRRSRARKDIAHFLIARLGLKLTAITTLKLETRLNVLSGFFRC